MGRRLGIAEHLSAQRGEVMLLWPRACLGQPAAKRRTEKEYGKQSPGKNLLLGRKRGSLISSAPAEWGTLLMHQ